MRQWTKFLPFFIVEYIAKKHLEKFTIANETVVIPYKGVYIRIEKEQKQ